MQQVKVNNEIYEVPISWSELNYWKACQVLNLVGDKGKQLALLSKIPMQLIDIMPNNQIQIFFDLISFTENLEVFEGQEVLDEYKDFDFGSIEYGKAEAIKKIMAKDLSGFEVAAESIKFLYNKDINEMPFLEVIGTANFFLSKLLASIIVSPNLEKVKRAMNKSKLELKDYTVLVALQHTLNSQGVEQSETQ
jgi:hypothetical protein